MIFDVVAEECNFLTPNQDLVILSIMLRFLQRAKKVLRRVKSSGKVSAPRRKLSKIAIIHASKSAKALSTVRCRSIDAGDIPSGMKRGLTSLQIVCIDSLELVSLSRAN